MKRELYQQVVKTFFACDPQAVTGIFRELLLAMQAEETLPPTIQMTQNYETAQANPEIHVLPGNLKDARDAVFPPRWVGAITPAALSW